jgi:rhodanese-related sulfurtransferase
VDGARPELALAEKYGLRYVHIPIGYDAIPEKAKLSLARLMRETSEPVYVHCHHGRHRGPAAAAVACQAAGQADSKLATQMLEAAGTGEHYTGLWRDVSRFTPVPETTEYPDLVSLAEVDSLSAMMAKVDRNLDHLETMQESDWQPPPDHPDLDPAQETLMIQERFREAERLLDDSYDAQFRRWLKPAESISADLRRAFEEKEPAPTRAAPLLNQLKNSCSQYHLAYRN